MVKPQTHRGSVKEEPFGAFPVGEDVIAEMLVLGGQVQFWKNDELVATKAGTGYPPRASHNFGPHTQDDIYGVCVIPRPPNQYRWVGKLVRW